MRLIQPLILGLVIAASLGSDAFAVPLKPSNQIQRSPQPASLEIRGAKQPPSTVPGVGGPGVLHGGCPEGQNPSSWQKPIYDQAGLFVVGWETVATCIPEDLEPAG